MQIGKVDVNKLHGLSNKFLGLGKELVGTLIGNERLEQEGEAQQARAGEELRAMRSQAKAQAEDAKAEVLDQEQRAAQRDKETTA